MLYATIFSGAPIVILLKSEIVAFLIVFIILFDMHRNRTIRTGRNDRFITEMIVVYIIFLSISIVAHFAAEGLIETPSALTDLISTVHFNSIPVLLLFWLYYTGVNTLPRKNRLKVYLSAGTFAYILFLYQQIRSADNQSFFLIDSNNLLVRNRGFLILILVSCLECLLMFSIVSFNKKNLTNEKFVIYITAPVVMASSLVLFYYSGNHPLFTVSVAFLLLFNHLFRQREQLTKDGITNLPNTVAFDAEIERIFLKKSKKIVFVLDIDNFSAINQRYGITFGDKVLKHLSNFLLTVENVDAAYRLSSDRFGLVADGESYNTATSIVRQINKRCEKSWGIGLKDILISINTAIVMIPKHAGNTQEFKDSVDFAVTMLKSSNKLSAVIYNKKLFLSRQRKLDVETALRSAVYNDSHIVVEFQPIFDIETNRLCAAEALTRINDPSLGLIMPGEFIPIAETDGLITRISEIVLQKTCRFIKENESLVKKLNYISLNLSVEDLSVPHIATKLLGIIDSYEIDPSIIAFELTESMLLERMKESRAVLETFAQRDITIILDDFGVGYSNLNILAKMPFDVIKIDKSLLKNYDEDTDSLHIIADMLHRFKKKIVIEGVETKEHLHYSSRAGIEMVQGYYFSRPVDYLRFEDILEENFKADINSNSQTARSKKKNLGLRKALMNFAIPDR